MPTGLAYVVRPHSSGFHYDAKKYRDKISFWMFVTFPNSKTHLELLKKEKTKMKAREAGSMFSGLKMGSLCHVVGT